MNVRCYSIIPCLTISVERFAMKKMFLFLFGMVVVAILVSDQGYAIPAFARKYKTSCQTCHNGFPKLNAFGEAFRRNGYQFPGGTDAEFIKEEPVSLGSEGNKKAFPDAIWPGTLPGSSPISLFLNGEIDYNPGSNPNNADLTGVPRFSFGGLGNSIEAVAAGTLGEDLTFWGHGILNSDGTVELNRMFLIFSNVLSDNMNFNVKVGVFEPGLFSFSTHRAWMEGFWMTTRNFDNDPDADYHNGMGWTLEETQKGVEVNGVLQGRFGYNLGVVEGFGNLHSGKDFYGHLTYKLEGLPLDGVTEGTSPITSSQPYVDNSLTIGTFLYHGNASIGPDSATQENQFTMGGGDINAYYDRFNLFGGVGLRHDEHPFIGSTIQSANSAVAFAELDVVVFPWLLPGLRYESWNGKTLDQGTGNLISYTDQQFVPGIVALIRPNLKMTLRTTIEKFDSRSDDKFYFGLASLGLAVGI